MSLLKTFVSDFSTYITALGSSKVDQNAALEYESIGNIPIFVVNMERSKHRRDFMLGYLSRLGLKPNIFTAVDGRGLDLDDLAEKNIYDDALAQKAFSRSLKMSEIGCALSHLNIYKKIIEENIEVAIILEDDVMFADGAGAKLNKLMKELPGNWDLVLLFYRCRDYTKISETLAKFNLNECLPCGAPGYILRNSGAVKLLKEGFPIRYPSDSLIGRSYRWGTNIFGSVPELVVLNNIFPTEIREPKTLFQKFMYYTRNLSLKIGNKIFGRM